MKVPSINSNNYNISYKAHIKPNANFHMLYGLDAQSSNGLVIVNPKLVKQMNELPNHCIEILKLNKLNNSLNGFAKSQESILDETECIIVNHTTKRTANIYLANKVTPLNQLIKGIIALKNKDFFNNEMIGTEKVFYETLTTGKPLDESFVKTIDNLG